MRFRVIDRNTGVEADMQQVALTEKWASGLAWCDMECFALSQFGGAPLLMDECGNVAYCPDGRFMIEMLPE